MILHRKHPDRRKATSVVEMAFVLSLCVLFIFGILEYGRYLFFMHVATVATTAGARYAVVHTGDGTTSAQVTTEVNNLMNGQQSMVTSYTVSVFAAQAGVTPPAAIGGSNWNDPQFGGGICVRITGTYPFVAGSLIGLSSLPVNVSSVMTSEAN